MSDRRQVLQEAEKALEPFGKAAEPFDRTWYNIDGEMKPYTDESLAYDTHFSVGELRAARSTLALIRASLAEGEPPETQATVSAWCEATFGAASSNARVAARANEEMAEMLKDLTRRDDDAHAIEEAADVVIILYRLAARMDRDLNAEVDRKMAINRKRQWNVGPDGHGYHVKAAPVTAKDQA